MCKIWTTIELIRLQIELPRSPVSRHTCTCLICLPNDPSIHPIFPIFQPEEDKLMNNQCSLLVSFQVSSRSSSRRESRHVSLSLCPLFYWRWIYHWTDHELMVAEWDSIFGFIIQHSPTYYKYYQLTGIVQKCCGGGLRWQIKGLITSELWPGV